MKAFVSGGAGFLGINLVHELLEQGWEVYALYVKGEDLKYLKKTTACLVEGNILDITGLEAGMPEKLDAVFHVAGDISLWDKTSPRQYKVNVEGSRNMAAVALKKSAKRFIHTSSTSAWGIHENICIDETFPSNAMQSGIPYKKTKYLGELEIDKAINNGLDAVIVNPGNMIGPFDTDGWVRIFKMVLEDNLEAIATGSGMFCHVRAVAKAHISAFHHGKTGERYLLGGHKTSFLRIINLAQRILKKKVTRRTTSNTDLRLAAHFFTFISFFTKRRPKLTIQEYKILTANISSSNEKAINELKFEFPELKATVADALEWLQDSSTH